MTCEARRPAEPRGAVRTFDEVQRGRAVAAVGNITSAELNEIRRLQHPPPIVRRALEATCLLLNASQAVKSGHPSQPDWPWVQRLLGSATFVQRMLDYDVAQLRAAPALIAYVAAEYFGVEKKRGTQRSVPRLGPRGQVPKAEEPLTYKRLHEASQVAAVLFSWSASALVLTDGTLELDAACFPDPPALPPEVEQEKENQVEEDEEVNLDAAAELAAEADPTPEPMQFTSLELPVSPTLQFESEEQDLELGIAAPDRHFEEIVSFEFGESSIGEEQEADLGLVAAALKGRPQLKLHLVGCVNEVEDSAVIKLRLQESQGYFLRQDIDCAAQPDDGALEVSARWPSGVVCQLLLDDDEALRNYYTDRWCSDASPRTRSAADWLESHFHCCMH